MNRLVLSIRNNLKNNNLNSINNIKNLFYHEEFNFLHQYNNNFKLIDPEETGYIRQPIYSEKTFELFYIKWPKMVSTPVHNHKNDCLFKVIDGKLNENIYSTYLDSYNLKLQKTLIENEISYMNSDLGFHEITNIEKKDAYSIHLYIK